METTDIRIGEEKRLLTAKEAANLLGITPKTLWQWFHRGIIRQVRFPGAMARVDSCEGKQPKGRHNCAAKPYGITIKQNIPEERIAERLTVKCQTDLDTTFINQKRDSMADCLRQFYKWSIANSSESWSP